MNRRILFPLIVLIALLVFAVPAWAGGWVVFTLEELPARVVAGEPVTIEFAVRQHGSHLNSSFGTPAVYARNPATGERLTFQTEPTGQEGYFTAKLVFREEGVWTWGIGWVQNTRYLQNMPPLNVLAAGASAATPRPALVSVPFAVGVVGLAILGGAGLAFFATRNRWALSAGLAGMLLAAAGLAGAFQPPAAAEADAPPAYASPVELGRALFWAKGCVVCHTHAEGRAGFTGPTINVGPELTDTVLPPEYLRVWLKDPEAVKPKTQMPNLALDEAEIEALIAFLTAHQ